MHMYNLEITKQNRFKQFCSRFRRITEEKLFNLLIKIPDKLLPLFAVKWIGNYVNKRNSELRIQATRMKYNNAYLLQAVEDLQNQEIFK